MKRLIQFSVTAFVVVGVLIFAALADHQVEVIADKGIHDRVSPRQSKSKHTQPPRMQRPLLPPVQNVTS